MTAVFEDLSLGDAEVFTDIPPGSTVELPPAPISERSNPAVVWSGTEMIVWGGMDADQATLDDGAAFDLATGTWRVIAPAPDRASPVPAVAWTGTEMLVWGGQRTNASGDATEASYGRRRLRPDDRHRGDACPTVRSMRGSSGQRECGPATSSSSSDSRRIPRLGESHPDGRVRPGHGRVASAR